MRVLYALPHDITGQCMQLLHGLCCFDFDSDIPLSLANLRACTVLFCPLSMVNSDISVVGKHNSTKDGTFS